MALGWRIQLLATLLTVSMITILRPAGQASHRGDPTNDPMTYGVYEGVTGFDSKRGLNPLTDPTHQKPYRGV